jgi:hypothetical protein
VIQKKKMGRPKLPKGEARTEVIHARVSKEEKTRISRYLKEKELSLTDLILNNIDKSPA